MNIKQTVKSQYGAALAMLEHVTSQCPALMWDDPADQNRFWRVAYHALFYTHLYLQPREEDFAPWDKHREGVYSLGKPSGEDVDPELKPYSREEILEYLAFCRGEVEAQVATLDLAAVQQARAPVLQHPTRPASHWRALRAGGCHRQDRGGLGRDAQDVEGGPHPGYRGLWREAVGRKCLSRRLSSTADWMKRSKDRRLFLTKFTFICIIFIGFIKQFSPGRLVAVLYSRRSK